MSRDPLKSLKFPYRYGTGPVFKEHPMLTPTHVYTGPNTAWGLVTFEKVNLSNERGPSGLKVVLRVTDARKFYVAASHLRVI